ncbi:ATP-binding protein [Amycolatopsis sp. VS8301801F10]|uniref:ATP-binding protein n=1 Tax=Amycolatopsis sp. VS8301801F10 TaxID=2652442 RepID=UPI0038FC0DFB
MPDHDRQHGIQPWIVDLHGTAPPDLARIRRWASRNLSSLRDDHLSDVHLVVTELVDNAFNHGHRPIQLRMSHTPDPCRVRIEVDDSSPYRPMIARPSPDRAGGRGMLLVAQLSDAWGVVAAPGVGGKTVWAEISCAGPERTPCYAGTGHNHHPLTSGSD